MVQPPLNALKCFETVARLGSFKAAAQHLCVTQSAVSHQIKKVEDWLGGPLFDRLPQGVRLLQRGEALAQRLTLAFAEIENACTDLRLDDQQPLVIAAIPSIAMCWLIPRLPDFRDAYPALDIQVIYARHQESPNFKLVHCAITYNRVMPSYPEVESHFFLSGDCVPVCRPNLLDDRNRPPRDADAFQALGLLHDSDRSGWSEWLDQPGPLPGPIFEDFNMLRTAVMSGQGVALCPLAMITRDIEAGHLIALSDEPRAMGSNYYISTRQRAGRAMERKIAIFRDWALQQAGLRPAAKPSSPLT